jgi:hypothetical protein
MISDLDETIKQLMIHKGSLNQNEIVFSFEAPDRDWAASNSKPTINFYLYDIRENHELRTYDWTVEQNKNRTSTRKKAPMRVDLSYAVTVWTKAVDDEHRLLGHLMVVLMKYPLIPPEVFQGSLKNLEYPLYASTMQPENVLKSPADFWTALDNKLKPSLNYIVTMPINLDISITAPIVTTKTIEVKDKEKGDLEEIIEIGGRISRKTKPEEGIRGASVKIKNSGYSAITDVKGQYKLIKVKRGTYTFEVTVPGKPARNFELTIPSDNYNIEL